MFSSTLVKAGIAAIAAATTAVAASLPEISAVGNKFFDPSGKQFFIKGMANSVLDVLCQLLIHVSRHCVSIDSP
jgi:hypothetical protein